MANETQDAVRQLALKLPGVVESVSYGTPSFKVKDKMIARFRDEGQTLVLKTDFETRDFLLLVNPEAYYITDHYKDYPYVLVRLDAADMNDLYGQLARAWKAVAPKKLLAELEEKQHE